MISTLVAYNKIAPQNTRFDGTAQNSRFRTYPGEMQNQGYPQQTHTGQMNYRPQGYIQQMQNGQNRGYMRYDINRQQTNILSCWRCGSKEHLIRNCPSEVITHEQTQNKSSLNDQTSRKETPGSSWMSPRL